MRRCAPPAAADAQSTATETAARTTGAAEVIPEPRTKRKLFRLPFGKKD